MDDYYSQVRTVAHCLFSYLSFFFFYMMYVYTMRWCVFFCSKNLSLQRLENLLNSFDIANEVCENELPRAFG